MFDINKNHESHCSKSKKRMHTNRAALNRLLDENDTSQTLTTLASAAAALGKKVNLELLDQRSVLRQLIFSLWSSSTSKGVEQKWFQSSVSRHGVELLRNLVWAPSLASNFHA